MLKTIEISPKQVKLILAAQMAVERAQRDLDVVIGAVIAGHDVEGQVVSVDADLNVLNVEIPDEKPQLELEA